MRTAAQILAVMALAGCGSDGAQLVGSFDLAVSNPATADLLAPTACSPIDPMSDGTACSLGCPASTIGVSLGGSCKCYGKCSVDTECSCNRFCDTLTLNDAAAGSACLPGNAPGERCGRDAASGVPFGNGFCGQLAVCVNADLPRLFRYCNYKCNVQADCPTQTTCQPLMDNQGNTIGRVCSYDSGPNGNKDLGQACAVGDLCQTGQLCDGVCRPQCDGPGASCATGSCQRLDDAASAKVVGFVCK